MAFTASEKAPKTFQCRIPIPQDRAGAGARVRDAGAGHPPRRGRLIAVQVFGLIGMSGQAEQYRKVTSGTKNDGLRTNASPLPKSTETPGSQGVLFVVFRADGPRLGA